MYLIVNFKQNLNIAEYRHYVSELSKFLKNQRLGIDLILCPPFPYLMLFKNELGSYERVFIGAQDVSSYKEGSHTGGVSASHLEGIVDYCIVNHSETIPEDILVGSELKEKLSHLAEHKIHPIICLKGYDPRSVGIPVKDSTLIAFEDPTHIGKSEASSSTDIENFYKKFTIKPKLLYGGSVSLDNINSLMDSKFLSGFLVSSYALKVENLIRLIKSSI
ncbi:triosephosphate isomerase [bacterium]|nr:triosephosphate isomerase [bacterium]